MPCTNHPVVESNLVTCSRCNKPFCQDCVVELKSNFYCIDCKMEQVKDIQSGTDHTEMDLAGVGSRFGAIFIDGLIMGVPVGIAMAVMIMSAAASNSPGEILAASLGIRVVMFLVTTVYEGAMIAAKGQTLGKMVCKVKVVTPEGNDLSAGQAWTRAVTKAILNQIPLVGLINYLIAFRSERTCIHDMAAKTRVINWRQ